MKFLTNPRLKKKKRTLNKKIKKDPYRDCLESRKSGGQIKGQKHRPETKKKGLCFVNEANGSCRERTRDLRGRRSSRAEAEIKILLLVIYFLSKLWDLSILYIRMCPEKIIIIYCWILYTFSFFWRNGFCTLCLGFFLFSIFRQREETPYNYKKKGDTGEAKTNNRYIINYYLPTQA